MYTTFNHVTRHLGSYEKLISHTVTDHPTISSIDFNFRLYSNHGAPCSIIMRPQAGEDKRVHNAMKNICADLNKVPDHLDIRPSEINTGSDWKHRDPNGNIIDFGSGNNSYPNYKGRHSHCGGDPTIDKIAAENAIPVLSKFIFGLKEKNILSQEQAQAAFQDMFSQVQRIHAELSLKPVSTSRDINGTCSTYNVSRPL